MNTVTSPISKLEKCVIVGALQCALPPWRRFFIGEHNPPVLPSGEERGQIGGRDSLGDCDNICEGKITFHGDFWKVHEPMVPNMCPTWALQCIFFTQQTSEVKILLF